MTSRYFASYADDISQFMAKASQELPISPIVPSTEVRKLRAKLILEECLETIRGLGFDVADSRLIEVTDPDIEEVIDGVADILVVSIGTSLAFGVDIEPIFDAVNQANLAKFAEGGYRRDDGKWIKPPDWKAPDIRELLVKQGYY